MNLFHGLTSNQVRELQPQELHFLASFYQLEQVNSRCFHVLEIERELRRQFPKGLAPAIPVLLRDIQNVGVPVTLQISPWAICWLASWCTKSGHPFAIAMSLKEFAAEENMNRLTLGMLMQFFNSGIPSEKTLDDSWSVYQSQLSILNVQKYTQ